MRITRNQLRQLIREAIASEDAPKDIMRVRDFIDLLGELDQLAPIFISPDSSGDYPSSPGVVAGFADLSIDRFSKDPSLVGGDALTAVMIQPQQVISQTTGFDPHEAIESEMTNYEDYDKWDSDPNKNAIELALEKAFGLKAKGFQLNVDVSFPGQYHVLGRGDMIGLEQKVGVDVQAVAAVLQKAGYKTKLEHDGLYAHDQRY